MLHSPLKRHAYLVELREERPALQCTRFIHAHLIREWMQAEHTGA